MWPAQAGGPSGASSAGSAEPGGPLVQVTKGGTQAAGGGCWEWSPGWLSVLTLLLICCVAWVALFSSGLSFSICTMCVYVSGVADSCASRSRAGEEEWPDRKELCGEEGRNRRAPGHDMSPSSSGKWPCFCRPHCHCWSDDAAWPERVQASDDRALGAQVYPVAAGCPSLAPRHPLTLGMVPAS